MRRFAETLLVICSLLTAASSQVQPKPLSNKDVIEMVSLGLSDDVIIEKIRSVKATNFDTSVEGLKSLKARKVSDAVLKAMINPHGSPTGTSLGMTAEQGNGVAEDNTGMMYLRGLGVAQDYQQALVWFRRAADQHNSSAESNLGWMYEQGLGVAQDYQQAVTWYRKAADQGNAVGQCNLGWMYQHGLGVAQDYQQALSLYRKAADQGNVQAENQLGMLYKDGNGVPRDDQQSIVWFRKAADQGYATAELNLGWMFANGRGVAQDYQQALSLYRKAADQGSEDAQRYLDELPSAVRERAGQPVSIPNPQSAAAPVVPATGSEAQARSANEGLVDTAVGQNDTRSGQVNDDTSAKSTAYAIEATAAIGNMMKDPTSFKVLQVIALTKQVKDGRTSFRGCVHYVGSNSYGGRLQQWGGYSVNKKGQLKSWPGGEYTDCLMYKNEVQTDVTTEVRKALWGQ